MQACTNQLEVSLSALIQLECEHPFNSLSALAADIAVVHSALVALLTRHAQTLSHRASRTHTTLSATDELANALKPELASIVLTLQGLCLVDGRAKGELGQVWMLEVG